MADSEQTTEIETFNKQMVGAIADDIMILNPQRRMTKTEALLHAAWIVALADNSDDCADFKRVLEAVQAS